MKVLVEPRDAHCPLGALTTTQHTRSSVAARRERLTRSGDAMAIDSIRTDFVDRKGLRGRTSMR